MYNIRLAEENDIDVCLEMGRKFYDTMEMAKMIPYCEDSASALFFTLLDNGFILLAEKDEEVVGMMGMMFSDYPYNREYQVCSELMYWLDPEHRGSSLASRMLKEAEAIAVVEGAVCVVMAALETSPEMIEKFYNKHGYCRSERAFVKGV